MLMTTEYGIRKVARAVKAGDARVVGQTSFGDRWPDEPHAWIIEHLGEQETHHVLVDDRPSWAKYLQESA